MKRIAAKRKHRGTAMKGKPNVAERSRKRNRKKTRTKSGGK